MTLRLIALLLLFPVWLHADTYPRQPVFPKDRDAGRQLFEDRSWRALRFFSSQISPYPYEKLANVQAAGFTGGTEYASAIFDGERGVSSGRGPVVYEIAHQWFGDSVTEQHRQGAEQPRLPERWMGAAHAQ